MIFLVQKASHAFLRLSDPGEIAPGSVISLRAVSRHLFRPEYFRFGDLDLDGLLIVDAGIRKQTGEYRPQLLPGLRGEPLRELVYPSSVFGTLRWDTAEAGDAIEVRIRTERALNGIGFDLVGRAAVGDDSDRYEVDAGK